MRIFCGLSDVAGYYTRLRRGMLELGVDCLVVELIPHPYEYSDEVPPAVVRVARFAFSLQGIQTSRWPSRLFLNLFRRLSMCLLFVWALVRFDTFIFASMTYFVTPHELILLKLCRKRVIHVFHGSDSRPAYIDGAHAFGKDYDPIALSLAAAEQKRRIRLVERRSDVIVGSPIHSHFHERPIVNLLDLGLPVDCSAAGDLPCREVVQILHAPSLPEAKGSARIRQVVATLRASGMNAELKEITARPHGEVASALETCDFVIDQAYSDAPMSGLAAEAAGRGRVALIGGYASGTIADWLNQDATPPTVYVHPDGLLDAAAQLTSDFEYRRDLGARASRFARERFVPHAVAARYLRVVSGDIPQEWMYDPRALRYTHGAGLSEDLARRLVGSVIALGGLAALQVADKPELERSLQAFANGR
jgi:hypothetical protein